jgi:hypothetical protein
MRKVIQQNPMIQKKNQKQPRKQNSQPLKANKNDSRKRKQIPETDKIHTHEVKQNEHIQEGTKLSALREMRTHFPQPPAVQIHFQRPENE